jgi:hypothetical protein
MVMLGNADCFFMIFIDVLYSFLCYAIYWFLSQLVYGCDGHSGSVSSILLYSFMRLSGFSGLEVACWPLVPKFAGSHLTEAVGFLGQKNPQHAFLRRESKAIGPMS